MAKKDWSSALFFGVIVIIAIAAVYGFWQQVTVGQALRLQYQLEPTFTPLQTVETTTTQISPTLDAGTLTTTQTETIKSSGGVSQGAGSLMQSFIEAHEGTLPLESQGVFQTYGAVADLYQQSLSRGVVPSEEQVRSMGAQVVSAGEGLNQFILRSGAYVIGVNDDCQKGSNPEVTGFTLSPCGSASGNKLTAAQVAGSPAASYAMIASLHQKKGKDLAGVYKVPSDVPFAFDVRMSSIEPLTWTAKGLIVIGCVVVGVLVKGCASGSPGTQYTCTCHNDLTDSNTVITVCSQSAQDAVSDCKLKCGSAQDVQGAPTQKLGADGKPIACNG